MALRHLPRLAVLWLAFGASAHAVVERTVEKAFLVGTDTVPHLRIDAFAGNIIVKEAAEPDRQREIRLRVLQRMEVEKDEEADRILERLELKLSQEGQTVRVDVQFRTDATWTWKNWPPVFLTFEVTVPARCHATLATRGSTITVGKLEGDLDLRNDSGAIFASETKGNVFIRSQRGDIALTACTGTFDAATMSGGILAGRVGGAAMVASDGGDIEVQTARAGVTAKGNGSDVTIGFDHPITQPASIETSGGDVTLKLDPRSACVVDARASRFGSVRVRGLELRPTRGAIGKSRLEATLGAGGPRIMVHASGGQVQMLGVERSPLP